MLHIVWLDAAQELVTIFWWSAAPSPPAPLLPQRRDMSLGGQIWTSEAPGEGGQMDGRTYGWMDGWTDKRMNGQTGIPPVFYRTFVLFGVATLLPFDFNEQTKAGQRYRWPYHSLQTVTLESRSRFSVRSGNCIIKESARTKVTYAVSYWEWNPNSASKIFLFFFHFLHEFFFTARHATRHITTTYPFSIMWQWSMGSRKIWRQCCLFELYAKRNTRKTTRKSRLKVR